MASMTLMEEELQHSMATSDEDAEFEEDDELDINIHAENSDSFAANSQLLNGVSGHHDDEEEEDGESEDEEEDEETGETGSDEDAEGEEDDEAGQENVGTQDEDEEGEESEEEDGEGVGAVKIQPGQLEDDEEASAQDEDEDEDDDSDASVEIPSKETSEVESEVEAEWEAVAEEDEDGDGEPANRNRCVYVYLSIWLTGSHIHSNMHLRFCHQDEEHDPSEDFEEYLACAVCGDNCKLSSICFVFFCRIGLTTKQHIGNAPEMPVPSNQMTVILPTPTPKIVS